MLTTNDIRTAFIEYFKNKQHTGVDSSSLVPSNDKTLLFTNAGMVQFKEVFLGLESRSFSRAVTAQKCVRAGGKHNDLENVGYTARHHTFFEMLGNFSFGDYFKRQAIEYAWEFITKTLGLPEDKLWVTVYEQDTEAETIWLEDIGFPAERISRIGAKDNFWQMGETGPCGPCSEIFYDHGPSVSGGPPGTPEEDGDRYIEIWNLVFMQYNRLADGTLEPLPNPSVDTGMGLERIAAILQGKHNNYDIDLFQDLIQSIGELLQVNTRDNPSAKVIADHIRSCAFLIADGVIPSNEGRGYVLRRIIRRAARHGFQLGAGEPFFYQLVKPLSASMGGAYPELIQKQALIEQTLYREEVQFLKTLSHGMKLLEERLDASTKWIDGQLAFKLYDTYGFPLDLTLDIAREKGIEVDVAGFEQAMERQRAKAKSASQFSVDYNETIKSDIQTEFKGYTHHILDARVAGMYVDGQAVDVINQGDEAVIVLEQTPFYAEAGGQVGDVGVIESFSGQFEVTDTQKSGEAYLHVGRVIKGTLTLDDEVTAHIEVNKRKNTARNHSATHLLHAALREIIGPEVEQKGSLVNDQRLRFDFSCSHPIAQATIREVEQLVNAAIRSNLPVETIVTTKDHANELGAMALFDEKYDDRVRVLKMGDFSVELCGGTHVEATGEIGFFKILSQSGIASGVRRIEAVTGLKALDWVNQQEDLLATMADQLKSKPEQLTTKVEKLLQTIKSYEKQIEKLQSDLAKGAAGAQAHQDSVGDIEVITHFLPGADVKVLRKQMDDYKSQHRQAIIVLASDHNDKAMIVVGVSQAITHRVQASQLVKTLAPMVGGKGGGRPDMAQAGGVNPSGISDMLRSVKDHVEKQLS